MARHPAREVSFLLQAWRNGDHEALNELMPLVHDELHRLAHRYMRRERAGHTLQTTALVNEAYLLLIGARSIDWRDRAHFFAVSANLMRRILVDAARLRTCRKRGFGIKRVLLDEEQMPSPEPVVDLVRLDEALRLLSNLNPRKAQVVELRFFGGLSVEETAEVLKVSPDTVKRDWRMAKNWLLCELKDTGDHGC